MWTRRKLIGTAVTGATGLTLAAPRASNAQSASGDDQEPHGVMWKTCCDTCGDCAKACNKAFHHCLTQAVAVAKSPHGRMAQVVADCAAFCALSSELLARSSTLALISCKACAEACRRCAQECASFDTDLEMKMCLQECQRCEESCRKMIKAMDGKSTPNQPATGAASRIQN
jgi:hypothetical protein